LCIHNCKQNSAKKIIYEISTPSGTVKQIKKKKIYEISRVFDIVFRFKLKVLSKIKLGLYIWRAKT